MGKRIMLFLVTNVLVVMTISIITSVFGVNEYFSANGMSYGGLLFMCLLWGSVGSIISLSISKWSAKRMMGVEILDVNGASGNLVRRVHHLAKSAGIEKMPEVGIYNSPEVNAFATGPSKNNSLVAVSTGLLNSMSDDEVDGVLAHEIAHVANGDMVTMALVQGVVNAFVMFFSRVITMMIDAALRGDDEEGEGLGFFAHMMVVMLLDMVFSFLAMPIIAWFSRYREFRADAGGAKLAGNNKMIAALESLQRNVQNVGQSEGNFQSMKISNKGSWMALFSTHPPLEKRIAALKY
jgi:heat shock protein HtpX